MIPPAFSFHTQIFNVLHVPLSLNANGKNIKSMTKVGENEDRIIMSVIDLYLLSKGMTGLNYEFCLSNCTKYRQVADLRIYNVLFLYLYLFREGKI